MMLVLRSLSLKCQNDHHSFLFSTVTVWTSILR
jgi:hypothetical protein